MGMVMVRSDYYAFDPFSFLIIDVRAHIRLVSLHYLSFVVLIVLPEERPATPVWVCTTDAVSIHRAKLSVCIHDPVWCLLDRIHSLLSIIPCHATGHCSVGHSRVRISHLYFFE
jgi:hypothetical protein